MWGKPLGKGGVNPSQDWGLVDWLIPLHALEARGLGGFNWGGKASADPPRASDRSGRNRQGVADPSETLTGWGGGNPSGAESAAVAARGRAPRAGSITARPADTWRGPEGGACLPSRGPIARAPPVPHIYLGGAAAPFAPRVAPSAFSRLRL